MEMKVDTPFQAQQNQSSAAMERQKKKERAMSRKAVHSKSFAQNMFRGILEPEQVFPYPQVNNNFLYDSGTGAHYNRKLTTGPFS